MTIKNIKNFIIWKNRESRKTRSRKRCGTGTRRRTTTNRVCAQPVNQAEQNDIIQNPIRSREAELQEFGNKWSQISQTIRNRQKLIIFLEENCRSTKGKDTPILQSSQYNCQCTKSINFENNAKNIIFTYIRVEKTTRIMGKIRKKF